MFAVSIGGAVKKPNFGEIIAVSIWVRVRFKAYLCQNDYYIIWGAVYYGGLILAK